ncbi:hypothetical protein F3Y22_tig00109945pilonHSYRG00285 [Hibiscus syriacus]|uniref:RNase H type-1 domain-containing protein n=1 Tax=Hibiscus syriacus TaxID=106335 RepID=A0A6A3BSE2_HIBSY|nr:hypothetical protein F3Y22_tig00109945pilonHSYRG00285 [Hibiscus syriacus]
MLRNLFDELIIGIYSLERSFGVFGHRNSIIFDIEPEDNRLVFERGKHLMEVMCRTLLLESQHKELKLNCSGIRGRWKRPHYGWTKVNSDGASKAPTGLAACRGVIRGHEGEWKMGFTKFIGICSVHEAEIWGAYMGLSCAWELQEAQIILELDSSEALEAINSAGQEGLSYISSSIGTPLYMDSITVMRQRVSYAKVCVEVAVGYKISKTIGVKLQNGSFVSIGVEVKEAVPESVSSGLYATFVAPFSGPDESSKGAKMGSICEVPSGGAVGLGVGYVGCDLPVVASGRGNVVACVFGLVDLGHALGVAGLLCVEGDVVTCAFGLIDLVPALGVVDPLVWRGMLPLRLVKFDKFQQIWKRMLEVNVSSQYLTCSINFSVHSFYVFIVYGCNLESFEPVRGVIRKDIEALVSFIAPIIFYHCPGVVSFGDVVNSIPKPFWFFNFWAKDPNFLDIVASSWNVPIVESNHLKVLFLKLKRLKPILKGEFQELVVVEESFYRQKARALWVQGHHLSSFENIVNEVVGYFQKLLGTSNESVFGCSVDLHNELLGSTFSEAACNVFQARVTHAEIKRAMVEQYSDKAPGLAAENGIFCYHPKCYHLHLTNLCFANDLMIFSHGTLDYVMGVWQDALGIKLGVLLVRYLGIPLVAKRLSVVDCDPLLDNISSKI